MKFTRLQDVPASKLEALSKKSYFFGHKSVGRNILDGLRMVMAENPAIKLNIVESDSPSDIGPGVFMNENIGRNKHPDSKIAQFEQAMDAGLGNHVDRAFLKFCYVDVKQDGTPQEFFERYRHSIEALKAKYPETTFIHFTVPLESVPNALKANIKNLLGRESPEFRYNALRSQYNRLLRETYEGKEPLFDIAHLESIDPTTGKTYTFTYEGHEYESMAPGNTSDGGHLSDAGKRWIAEQLIIFLTNLES